MRASTKFPLSGGWPLFFTFSFFNFKKTFSKNLTCACLLGLGMLSAQTQLGANLPYTATTGSPNQYSIDYNAAANTAGFVDVTNASLPASPIVLVVPSAAAATYNATLTVRNSVTGCVSSSTAFTETVTLPPTLGNYSATTMTLGAQTTVTPDASPTNTTSIHVNASSGFNGTFYANPTTGVVNIINANPAGTHTVTVTAFGAGGSTSKTFTLAVQTGTACATKTFFSNAPDLSVGSPVAVKIDDFNNDGKQDLAIANQNSATVSIRLGDGAGNFTGTTTVSTNSSPSELAVGDFNGDGNQDLAIACGANGVSVRLGDGAGNFSGTTNFTIVTDGIAVGDFNNDGKLDLMYTNSAGGASSVSLRLGDGAGGFGSAITIGAGTGPNAIAVGDINNDGKLDFVTTNYGSGNVSVRLGDGAGNFSNAADVTGGLNTVGPALGDLNKDGKIDLSFCVIGSSAVFVRLGDGLGGFSGTTSLASGFPRSIVIGDFNNDGNPDLSVSSTGIDYWLGDGAGGFGSKNNVLPTGIAGNMLAVGDFNQDWRQDFVTGIYNPAGAYVRLGGCNVLPSITAGSPLTRQQGSSSATSTIATVSDTETAASSLTVSAVTVPTGISVLFINNGSGTITAFVGATCIATVGPNTVVLRVQDSYGGTSTANLTVNVTAATPPTTAAAGPNQTLCAMAPTALAANSPTVGTGGWSIITGPSTSTAQFNSLTNPAATFTPAGGIGTYTLRWTITGACAASTSDAVLTYNANPIMSCPSNITVEDNDLAFALSGATPTGGTYSGTGVSNGMFNPAVAGIGTYIVTYAYTSPAGCSGSCTYTITVVSGCPAVGTIWYVDGAAAPGGTGSSWACAFQNIQDAIDAASSGHEIWVKAGTYKPTKDPFGNASPSDPRDKTFYLKDGVALYGGFAGTETARSQRNWASNVTALSGDIGTAGVNTDNCYHVVLSVSDANTTVLDGFTVTKGNANYVGSFVVESKTILHNEGSGMFNNSTSPTLTNCVFNNNAALSSGGGIRNISSSPTIANCLFSGNIAHFGAGISNSSANPSLMNCTISGNNATGGGQNGGGLDNVASSPTLTNCLIWNNRTGTFTGTAAANMVDYNSTSTVTYSLIQNWNPAGTGNPNGIPNAALSNYPDFVTPLDPATAPSTAGDFHIGACSPAINLGTNTGAPATDLFGNVRPFGASVDLGVHEFQAAPTPAVALCQNTTVLLDGAGNGTLAASALNNGSTGCAPLSFSASKTAFTCTDLGANTVTLTVTGLNGATATCNATVTVVDQVAPNALCRDFVKTLGANGMATVTAAEVDNLSNDNCGTVNLVSVTPGSFGCANIGTNTVTLTVNDGHGNTSTCNATVTIADNTPPTALCRNVSVNLGGNAATVTAAQVDNGSSDNCGTANLSLSTTSFACANVGTNAVTLTVNDGHGNSSTCAATVTVSDATNPTALCQNISVNLNGSGTATVAASQINNASSDNCGIAGLALSTTSFTCSNIGANPVTLTVTDNSGRTATCAATVTVSDNTNPTAACQNVTVNLDGNGNAALSAAQVDGGSSDNCGIATRAVTPNAFTTSNIGANVATLTVTDNNGRTASCTATVTVTNTNLPNAACRPYTVSLNGGGMATVAAANVDGGSSAVGGIQSLGVLPNSFDCTDLGANTVTLTVTGNNSQTATCNTTVTVQDNTPPTVVCQNITVNLSGNGANITAAQVLNTGASTDNCGVVNAQSVSTSGFTCSSLGPNTVMLTANDGHGNTASCTATVTVNDHTPPTALCQNITVNLGAGGMASVSAAQVNNASTDNCGTANLVGVSPSSFTCANVGPNTVTLTVNDGQGNTATCAATVTVRDNTAPTALCRDVVLQLDANGNTALTAAQVNNGSSDNCALGTLSVGPNAFTLANLGLNTVTLTVPDANGNSATCTAQVTVENNQLPNAVCQNIVRSLGANGQVAISAADIDGGSTALGGIAGRVATPNLLTCTNIGSNTVTLTVTGNNGRQASCNATVTVNDATAPTALCKNATVNLDADGNATVAASQINNGSTDNCGTVNLSLSTTAFTCANLGANVVALTVNDGHGNTSTCAATVTVNDLVAPGIGCPGNQTVTGNATCQGILGSYAALATKSDNCSAPGSINVTQSPVSGGPFTGSQTVTLTATDGSNNTATCAFTVSVTDNTAPTITCPANQTVSANATCQGTVGDYVALAAKSDNCTAPGNINVTQSPALGGLFTGSQTVTLTATDAANNSATCAFIVSVTDNTAPTITCPANQTVTGNATCQGTLGSYAALATKSDNCSAPGSINVSQAPASGGLFTGSQTVTLTATDAANNMATCAFTVSVTDNTAPTITCPANQTVSANATCQGTVGDYVALATKSDNCTAPNNINVTQSPVSGTGIATTTTVTLTATDAANNSATCVFSVSIRDVTPPTVGCPTNQTVTANTNCQGTLGSYAALATKSDNCSAPTNISVSQIPASGGLFTGSQTVVLTASDFSENTATCVFTVTVADNTAPTITCPANQTVSANANCQGTVGDYVALATKSDNCTAPNNIGVTQSLASGTPIAGTTTVTLTATDAASNSATCVFSVSIRDVTPPTVGCPANQTVTANANCQGTLGSYAALATKSDNCSAPTNISVSQTPASGGLFTGNQTVVLTASDFSENTATCVFTVTVTDNTAPSITCPANQTVSANASCQGTMGNYVALATKSDNCTAPNSIGVTQSPVSGTVIAGTTTVTLTATDAAGNSATCVFAVSIRDVTPPTVGCPANQTVSATTNLPCVAVVNGIDATFNDLCSSVSVAYALGGATTGGNNGQASGQTFQAGSTTVTYTATDGVGLSSTCAFSVYVNPCQVTFNGVVTWKQDNTTGVKDVTIAVTGDRMGSATTATNGTYSLTLDPGSNFTLTPSKNANKLNGVNAQDVTRIQQHLSGGLITNPWQLVAADVNGNGQISSLDANILQLALLGNTGALAQMPKSWRFVPKTHTMASPPWGFPENIVLTGAAGTVNNLDFWGFKVGDLVSTYANPANSAGQPLVLTARDETLTAGQTLSVDVTAAALRDLNALQMALRFDPEYLQLSDMQALGGLPLGKDNFGTYQSAEGSIRVVWSDAQSAALRAGAPLFRLQFTVLEGGPALSEVLHLDDETLLGQVFHGDGSASGVSLRFEGVTAVQNPTADGLRAQLLQNLPNPFVHQTTIGFVLPEACEAQLRIVDAGGRVVVERRKQYPAGRNEERFDLQTAPGVLYYELTTSFGVLARKMVVVE